MRDGADPAGVTARTSDVTRDRAGTSEAEEMKTDADSEHVNAGTSDADGTMTVGADSAEAMTERTTTVAKDGSTATAKTMIEPQQQNHKK